jgi:hypothetical protein
MKNAAEAKSAAESRAKALGRQLGQCGSLLLGSEWLPLITEALRAERLLALEEAMQAVLREQLEGPTETEGDIGYMAAIGDCLNAIAALRASR